MRARWWIHVLSLKKKINNKKDGTGGIFSSTKGTLNDGGTNLPLELRNMMSMKYFCYSELVVVVVVVIVVVALLLVLFVAVVS